MHVRSALKQQRGLAALAALVMAGAGLSAGAFPGTAHASSAQKTPKADLRIAKVSAPDDKSVDITFNKSLGTDLLQFTEANAAYAGQYIRISGGSADGSDAALDGAPVAGVKGTVVHPVDSPGHRTLRIVFGDGVSLADHAYRLWLDGGDDSLGDLFFRGSEGNAVAGHTTPKTGFRGTSRDAGTPEVAAVRPDSSRDVEVDFASSVWSGMPTGAYDGKDLTLTGGGATLSPTYVEAVGGSDKKAYRLWFGSDLKRGTDYRLTLGKALKLTGSGGTGAEDLSARVKGGGAGYKPAGIAKVAVNDTGDQIMVRFSHRLAAVNPGGDPVPVKETETGVSGTTLTAAQVKSLFTFGGIRTTSGKDLAGALRDDAAYFTDAGTLYLKLDSGSRLRPGQDGSIALTKGAVTDITGAASTATGASGVTVPRYAPPRDTGYDPKAPDYLKVETHATTVFQHYDYAVNPDGISVAKDGVSDKVVGQTVKTIVAENKYVKATFAPDYGGRLLSIVYKPTGHDLLYTNPVGTPYGFSSKPAGTTGDSPFYQNWLMVWGGVFPTLSAAEHGKYWNVPWEHSVKQTKDSFSITVDKTDDLDYPYAPAKYTYGATGIQAKVTYSLTSHRPEVGMSVSLHNPTGEDKDYEYWTCTTLAPGAPSHDGSPTMSIVAPAKEVYQDPGYDWMKDREKPAHPATPDDGYLKFDSLKKMENWDGDGIAYGQDLDTLDQANWWGVVNHENNEGVVRVGDNTKTPGMKIWEWGQNSSFDTNPYAKGDSARPYIELWAGASKHFFTPTVLKAGDTISWKESFIPTMDLGDVTNANAEGAAQVNVAADGSASARLFSTRIGERLSASLVDATTGATVAHKDFTGDARTALKLAGNVPAGHQARLVLTDGHGATLLTAESAK